MIVKTSCLTSPTTKFTSIEKLFEIWSINKRFVKEIQSH